MKTDTLAHLTFKLISEPAHHQSLSDFIHSVHLFFEIVDALDKG